MKLLICLITEIKKKLNKLGVLTKLGFGRTHYEAVILLLLLCFLVYTKVYLPNKINHNIVRQQEQHLSDYIKDMQTKMLALENECEALAASEPEMVEKVIRREFSWGRKKEYILYYATSEDR